MTLSTLRAYCDQIAQIHATRQATEHSYRPALASLVETVGGSQVRALNEPSHIACGAPDFIVERNGVPAGHVECKDVGVSLDDVENDEQLRRYRDGLPNLILTNYLEFRWYTEGQLRETARLARLNGQNRMAFDRTGAAQVGVLFDGFFAADLPTINNPRELAERIAAKARLLRDGVERVFTQETRSGPLHGLLIAYQEALIQDLNSTDFADMQAQTAAYGLFAARCQHDPSRPFTRKEAVFAKTAPFLRDVFGRIAGPDIDPRLAWIVDDLARLLARADMAAILADFGRRTRQEDPVVHFYEDFLAAYDPKLREVRGVYYTPEPVVSYIVRSVDHLLRDRFGLADGLADTATVTVERPNGEPETSPRVLILDPAAGTGTFLREAIAAIRATIENKGLGGVWPDYVRDHLLPRLFGFELLMAPYAICHLKLALEIGGTEAGFTMPAGERLRVFLTNTLEKAHEAQSGILFAHEIVREAAGADDVKREKPVMVVLGNPPYSGHSANKGEWIRDLLHGIDKDDQTTTGNYFKVDGQPLGERNPKWLNDDYVKFIRFAQWRIDQTGEGVLGFVTNHSYLDSPTFRGMRQSLMATFDEIHVLDLHGNAKRKEHTPDGGKDENVFDIQQGVAIGLFVKYAKGNKQPAQVFHADLWGEREAGPHGGKYGWLAANDVATTRWAELSPKSPFYLFVPRNEALAEEYESGWKLTGIFPVHSVGLVTARDGLAIQWTSEDMRKTAADFVSRGVEEARNAYGLGGDVRDWKVSWAQEDVRSHPDSDKYVKPVLYRPFDTRFTYYTGESRGFICMPRPKVMRHMMAGPNLGLATTRSTEIAEGWEHVFISKNLIQHHTVSLKEVNYLFPLYVYPPRSSESEDNPFRREPNINPDFITTLSAAIGLAFIPDGAGNLETTFGPEDISRYIYAILHSPEYRRRYADFLKSDFPRIPLINDRTLFTRLTALGKQLAALHLMETEGENTPTFPAVGSNRMEKVRYAPPNDGLPGRVWINRDQYFEGVAPATWTFAIGGYRPAEKWLKDRKDRVLSFDDIIHYRRICAALAETPGIMTRIDESITLHGGWPLTC